MNTRADAKAKWILYKELELIPDTVEETHIKPSNLRSWLGSAWNLVVRWLAGHSEPRIWTTSNANGETDWHTYDPASGESGCFSSELEVRAWLERRYYR